MYNGIYNSIRVICIGYFLKYILYIYYEYFDKGMRKK